MSCDLNDILKKFDLQDQSNSIILAGHYAINEELNEISNLGMAEALSFEFGVHLYQRLKKTGGQPQLVLWINDIGISPALRHELKNSFVLPGNYRDIVQSILGTSGPEEIQVLFESTLRNRASKKLAGLYKSRQEVFEIGNSSNTGLQRCIDYDHCSLSTDKKVYSIPAPDGGRLVVKEGSNPKCNLILATLYDYLCRGEITRNRIISIFNVIYKNRIFLGQYVYSQLFNEKAGFLNYYIDYDGRLCC